MPVSETLNLAGLSRALRLLTTTRVMVGVPSDQEQPHLGIDPIGPNARNEPGQPLTNAEIGYIHEHGAPEVNIPARPHLVPGVASAKEEITRRLHDAAAAAMNGNLDLMDRNFHAAGMTAQSAVRNFIAAGVPPPLKPATVRNRRRRTKGSSYRRAATTAADTTPLIDTAAYIHSISYVIRRGGR